MSTRMCTTTSGRWPTPHATNARRSRCDLRIWSASSRWTASTARVERREERGPAHRNRAEPEAARQVHLPCPAIGGSGLSGVAGASGVSADASLPQLPHRRAVQGHVKNLRTSPVSKCPRVLQQNPGSQTSVYAAVARDIIEVHHLIRQREPDADRSRFGAYPPQFRPTECGQLEPDRLAVSPAASSMISAVISSCRTMPLRRLQCGKLALDLIVRRSHRFHARLVLRREGVERGVAKLRVQVVRGELAQKRLRRQVQERRVGVRRTGKAAPCRRETGGGVRHGCRGRAAIG